MATGTTRTKKQEVDRFKLQHDGGQICCIVNEGQPSKYASSVPIRTQISRALGAHFGSRSVEGRVLDQLNADVEALRSEIIGGATVHAAKSAGVQMYTLYLVDTTFSIELESDSLLSGLNMLAAAIKVKSEREEQFDKMVV